MCNSSAMHKVTKMRVQTCLKNEDFFVLCIWHSAIARISPRKWREKPHSG